MNIDRNRSLSVHLMPLIALSILLSACGGSDEPAAGAAATPESAAVAESPVAAPAESPEDKRMANAVVTSKTSAPVDLKYDVLTKPEIGQPFEIELALLPRLRADALEVEVTGIPGLAVVSGGALRFDGISGGERHVTKVLVQADAPGIYYVNVIARMVTQVQTEARTFSVPVVVGTVAPAAKATPATDASGDAIQVLPAEESGGPTEPGKP